MRTSNVVPEKIKPLFDAAFLAPTSFNLQHWQFVIIDDQDNKSTLSAVAKNWIHDFSPQYIIVLCGDINNWKDAETFSQHLSDEQRTMVREKSAMVYANSVQNQRDEVFRTCGFGLTNMIWKADQINLGASILYGLDDESLASMVDLKDGQIIVGAVALDDRIPGVSWDCDNDTNEILINNGW